MGNSVLEIMSYKMLCHKFIIRWNRKIQVHTRPNLLMSGKNLLKLVNTALRELYETHSHCSVSNANFTLG